MLYFTILFWILKIASDAAMDVITFKYNRSIFSTLNENYWNHKKSYRNKFKNKMPFKGAAYPGSRTIFVFLTDGFHLLQFISYMSGGLAFIFLVESQILNNWFHYLLLLLIIKVSYDYLFYLFRNRIFL